MVRPEDYDFNDLRVDPTRKLHPGYESWSMFMLPISLQNQMGPQLEDDRAEEYDA